MIIGGAATVLNSLFTRRGAIGRELLATMLRRARVALAASCDLH
jgi:hypothetical protein